MKNALRVLLGMVVIFTLSVVLVAGVKAKADRVIRADIHFQHDGDDPLGTGSGGRIGSAFLWVINQDGRKVLKVMGVMTPQGVLPPDKRPQSGDVYLGLFSKGTPDTAGRDAATQNDFEQIASFTPPAGDKKISVFATKILLPYEHDSDGDDLLEVRLVLKPRVRGLTQSCEGTDLCGASTRILSLPLSSKDGLQDDRGKVTM